MALDKSIMLDKLTDENRKLKADLQSKTDEWDYCERDLKEAQKQIETMEEEMKDLRRKHSQRLNDASEKNDQLNCKNAELEAELRKKYLEISMLKNEMANEKKLSDRDLNEMIADRDTLFEKLEETKKENKMLLADLADLEEFVRQKSLIIQRNVPSSPPPSPALTPPPFPPPPMKTPTK